MGSSFSGLQRHLGELQSARGWSQWLALRQWSPRSCPAPLRNACGDGLTSTALPRDGELITALNLMNYENGGISRLKHWPALVSKNEYPCSRCRWKALLHDSSGSFLLSGTNSTSNGCGTSLLPQMSWTALPMPCILYPSLWLYQHHYILILIPVISEPTLLQER